MHFITIVTTLTLISQITSTPLEPSPKFAPVHQDHQYKTDTQQSATTLQNRQAPGPDGTFGLIAIHSGSDVHFLPFAANNQHFFLAEPTASYCPNDDASCPSGNDTVFANGNGCLDLAVEVPGGQQVYIEADGALGFTQAHSASIPEGATLGGFEIDSVNLLPPNGDFVACTASTGGWQIFVPKATDVEKFAECIGIAAYIFPGSGVGAWEYV